MYCLFIDFKDAFDSVHHELLWHVLKKQGVKGKFLLTLKSMYSPLKSCVNTNDGLTEFFNCKVGTRQGCMISPMLFVFFINELYEVFYQNGCQGIYVDENLPNILSLMFADDIANVADFVTHLQQQLNQLNCFCENYGMKVNMSKTKIMLFRRGGIVKVNEKWYYQNKKLDIVSEYKYLGMYFTSFLKWRRTQMHQRQQAEKALTVVKSFLKKYFVSIKQKFFLFDKMITPILFYGAEIWGIIEIKEIEMVQHKFCKYVLNFGSQTPNCAVMGDCGRLPLYVQYVSKCIKYWLKIIHMNDNRYPKIVYKLLFDLDSNGRRTWPSDIRTLLYRYDFGVVWISQGLK